MTTRTLKAQINRDLALLADDESLMKRVANYVQRLVRQRKAQDDTLMTKEEFFVRVDRGIEQIKNGQCHTFHDMETMNKWLNSLADE